MKSSYRSEKGFSLFELVTVLGLSSALFGIATIGLQELVNPAQNGAAELAGFFKEARARALSSTAAYTVYPETSQRILVKFANTCSDVAVEHDDRLILDLPTEVSLTDISWEVCFNSRGFSDGSFSIPLEDMFEGERTVDIFLGGGIRVSEI